MVMKSIRYIGNFPPPYGGVTVKNQLLYNELLRSGVEVCKLNRIGKISSRIYKILTLILAIVSKKPLVVGVSAAGGTSWHLTRLLYLFNRKIMSQSIYFMMGGTESKRIAESELKKKIFSKYKKIYVETDGMRQDLLAVGMSNVQIYPNARKKPEVIFNVGKHGKLKMVFFSLICPQKGVDIILESAVKLPNVSFDFYGPIEDEYHQEFISRIDELSNAFYNGVFIGSSEAVYKELNKYDVLLFPTKYDTEGVPGILVESKISAITAIASDKSYNADLIKNEKEGLVIKDVSAASLTESIIRLDKDRYLLNDLKQGAEESAKAFYIETYMNDIVSNFRND